MRRFLLATTVLCALAEPVLAQTGTPATQTSLLNQFRDGQAAGSITPQTMRNLVVSNNTTLFPVDNYGAVGNGSTDDSTAVLAAITAEQANGGGTVLFGCKTYLISSVITGATTGTTPPILTAPIHLQGCGANSPGGFGTVVPGGTTLSLTFSGDGGTHVAKIDLRGMGVVEIDHMTLSSPSDTFPILQVTNTTPNFHNLRFLGEPSSCTGSFPASYTCVQTDLVLGGKNSSQSDISNGNSDAAFNGFGGYLANLYFDYCKHAIEYGSDANAIPLFNPTIANTCGSTGTNDGSITFTATGFGTNGNTIFGGIFEVSAFPYAVAMITGNSLNAGNNFIGMGLYDPGGGVLGAPTLGGIYTPDSTAEQNTVIGAWIPYAMRAVVFGGTQAPENTVINGMGTDGGTTVTLGVTCGAGSPSGSFQVSNGFVVHC